MSLSPLQMNKEQTEEARAAIDLLRSVLDSLCPGDVKIVLDAATQGYCLRCGKNLDVLPHYLRCYCHLEE
jgi:hypothetical protein